GQEQDDAQPQLTAITTIHLHSPFCEMFTIVYTPRMQKSYLVQADICAFYPFFFVSNTTTPSF
ncbi:MAG: hypothetical protein Q7U34_08755, partial [Anaerolineales bacterium]|nr:hypothetical protein [Anaerolineales bacterium]